MGGTEKAGGEKDFKKGRQTLLKFVRGGLLCLLHENVKQCPVLYDRQIKWYREKDALSNT